jgi:hypothetical protein
MERWIYALIAIAAGALFCFRGYFAFRIIIPIWGFFAGFSFGAGLVAAIADDGFLATGLSWLVGLAGGLLFAVLAYLFYEVAIMIAMGSIGFAIGAGALVALGVEWTWVVVLVGVIVGALLAIAAIAVDLPTVVLVVASAVGGASAITTGLMLLTGALDTADFTDESVTAQADNDWWWYVVYVVLVVLGITSQLRLTRRLLRPIREEWESAELA